MSITRAADSDGAGASTILYSARELSEIRENAKRENMLTSAFKTGDDNEILSSEMALSQINQINGKP